MPSRPPKHRPPHLGPPGAERERYDRWRGSAASRGYDHRWSKLRDAYLRANPACVTCTAAGDPRPATEVDHIVPIPVAPERRLDVPNLQSLCHPHHVEKTHRDRRAGAHPQGNST